MSFSPARMELAVKLLSTTPSPQATLAFVAWIIAAALNTPAAPLMLAVPQLDWIAAKTGIFFRFKEAASDVSSTLITSHLSFASFSSAPFTYLCLLARATQVFTCGFNVLLGTFTTHSPSQQVQHSSLHSFRCLLCRVQRFGHGWLLHLLGGTALLYCIVFKCYWVCKK